MLYALCSMLYAACSGPNLVPPNAYHCFSADGSTADVGARLEDVQARKAVCATDQQHMYPLGDGRGGLLTRRRWQGGSQRPQHVRHIGGCSGAVMLAGRQ